MGSKTPPTSLPYWQINVPPSLREDACPPFLSNLNAKDLRIVSMPDSEYRLLTWPEVRSIVSRNRIDLFQRVPSVLRRYLQYNYALKQKWGSVMNFVFSQRLGWEKPVVAEGKKPFENPRDWKILCNDWSYGLDPRIVHLVVWTKFELEDDEETGYLKAEPRALVERFMDEMFEKKMGKENVIWFKNWKSLKSIHSVEHFHVMLFDPDPEFVKEITHGDVPLSQKLKN